MFKVVFVLFAIIFAKNCFSVAINAAEIVARLRISQEFFECLSEKTKRSIGCKLEAANNEPLKRRQAMVECYKILLDALPEIEAKCRAELLEESADTMMLVQSQMKLVQSKMEIEGQEVRQRLALQNSFEGQLQQGRVFYHVNTKRLQGLCEYRLFYEDKRREVQALLQEVEAKLAEYSPTRSQMALLMAALREIRRDLQLMWEEVGKKLMYLKLFIENETRVRARSVELPDDLLPAGNYGHGPYPFPATESQRQMQKRWEVEAFFVRDGGGELAAAIEKAGGVEPFCARNEALLKTQQCDILCEAESIRAVAEHELNVEGLSRKYFHIYQQYITWKLQYQEFIHQ